MLIRKSHINDTRWLYLLLLLVSTLVYGYYFRQLVFHLNTVLYRADGDSLKNYYTFVWHCRNDTQALYFSGLNFPYGEHIVYTDCQPLLSLILRQFPFAGDYLIGILHSLILCSFIVTPLLLMRLFILLDTPKGPAFLFALSVALLSPQINRLGGHFALAYGFVIPLAILLFLRYQRQRRGIHLILCALYNTLLFLVHPYLGLGCSGFFAVALLCNELLRKEKQRLLNRLVPYLSAGLAPVVLFRGFMIVTDNRRDRPDEPWGMDIMDGAANMESVFTPFFGPFDPFLKLFFKSKHVEWETWSYVGIAPILLTALLLLSLPFCYRKIRIRQQVAALLITGLLFLLFSFGFHNSILRKLHLEVTALNQFRVVGRFAWFFYFLLPLALIPVLVQVVQLFVREKIRTLVLGSIAFLYLAFSLIEAGALFNFIMRGNFTSRNLFNTATLTAEEQRQLARIDSLKPQVIVPLPVFHIGSEVYQRNGPRSTAPAMFWSFHTGVPVLSDMLSRTSLRETENSIEALNIYKKNRPILDCLDQRPLLILLCDTLFQPDEQRLLQRLKPFSESTSIRFFSGTKADLRLSEHEKSEFRSMSTDSIPQNTVWIPSGKSSPYTTTRIDDFSPAFVMEPNQLSPGPYIVSFHYHLKMKKLRYIFSGLIVEKTYPPPLQWKHDLPVRVTSGFYDSVVVTESRMVIEKDERYRFLIHGKSKETYFISNFLIRPDTSNIRTCNKGHWSYNNYPE